MLDTFIEELIVVPPPVQFTQALAMARGAEPVGIAIGAVPNVALEASSVRKLVDPDGGWK